MKALIISLITLLLLMVHPLAEARTNTNPVDTLSSDTTAGTTDHVKTGWSWGAVPA